MFNKILMKVFGSRNERILKRLFKLVHDINRLELTFERLSNQQLKLKTKEFRNRLEAGSSLQNLMPEAYATVREASKRVLKMRHFDVQILGGIVLNNRCIAEMRTGEGKTLTSTLPAYLNALTNKGVHIVTVNEYLAERDAKSNSALFEFLDMSVGVNLSGMPKELKKSAYSSDITYSTNNEYAFDYLRDNMVFQLEDRVQNNLHYAIIDEVDSILIDEARTPLIISGAVEQSSYLYKEIDKLIPFFKKQNKEDTDSFNGSGHFFIDEKTRQVTLTERGLKLAEELLIKFNLIKNNKSLYSSSNIILMHHIMAALRAHNLFHKNVDYIIKNKKIAIVDEHTGRVMDGRRWSDGLHQALEAKENLKIQNENQTLASITFQNYFRLYEKLSGMTGTADTEAFEFKSIYKLDTIVIPTNRPMIRKDFSDLVYLTELEKIQAIVNDIKNCVKKGQPVLVGTISIEKSELISNELKKNKISHKVLNAKYHDQEAEIISEAGKIGSVTIATNMAGRGTDILLGGNWKSKLDYFSDLTLDKIIKIKNSWKKQYKKVSLLGGLHVIGTERHESRRIDNQLRGRSGRQGDPGSSRFYLSMEDSLIRIFISRRIVSFLKKLGIKYGEAIEHPWMTRAIANAQRKVENRNFEIRKQLLEYDDVANDQRIIIYSQRNYFLCSENIKKIICCFLNDVVLVLVKEFFIKRKIKKRDSFFFLKKVLKRDFNLKISANDIYFNFNFNKKIVYKNLYDRLYSQYKMKEKIFGYKKMCYLEKNLSLELLDSFWKEHLYFMDNLRKGIHLRGYAQKDPRQEYKIESFLMFSNMLERLKYEIISKISKLK